MPYKDPEKHRECMRECYAANLEKHRERKRKCYAANPEKQKERVRKRYAANPEKHRECRRKRYAANPEKVKERVRKYRAANPEKVKEYGQMRDARYFIKYGESYHTYRLYTNLAARIKYEEYRRSEQCREKGNAAKRKRYAANKAWMVSMGEKWRAEDAKNAQTGSATDTAKTNPVPHREMAGDTSQASSGEPDVRRVR